MHIRPIVGTAVVALLSGALVLTLAPAGPTTAEASTRHKHNTADKGTVSKETTKTLKIGENIVYKSRVGGWKKGNKSITLDYRKAMKYDDGHYKIRRQVAAGWRAGGGHLSHISKAERKKVNAYRRTPPPPPGCSVCLISPQAPDPATPTCTGKKAFHHSTHGVPTVITWENLDIWTNSCQTDLVVLYAGKISDTLGLIAVFVALTGEGVVAAVILEAASIILSMAQDEVSYWQNESQYDAVYWKVRYDYYTRLYPQN